MNRSCAVRTVPVTVRVNRSPKPLLQPLTAHRSPQTARERQNRDPDRAAHQNHRPAGGGPGSTTRITGFTELESRHLLELLFQHMTSAEYTVRFRWEPGSMAFWDNRSTCHFAPTDFAHLDVDRVMHRVTVLGEPAKGPTGFVSQLVEGEPMQAWWPKAAGRGLRPGAGRGTGRSPGSSKKEAGAVRWPAAG
ncbi:TauD/TfdA dioxygenase family protein [Streptomyces sp. NPDC018833]|uniref:TauD/TfdA dioxygenase family protein n=1 Tax=Streptomyces sp. NPDC018833 TaxID=3365053 RepID=UPI0037B98334